MKEHPGLSWSASQGKKKFGCPRYNTNTGIIMNPTILPERNIHFNKLILNRLDSTVRRSVYISLDR